MQNNKTNNKYAKFSILIVFLFVFLFIFWNIDVSSQEHIMDLILHMSESTALEVIYVAVATILLIFFVPISILSAVSAALFGMNGILFILIAGMLSALISFSIARIFKPDFSRIVERIYYRKNREQTLDEIYEKIKKYGIGYIFFLRAVPAIPFSFGNYLFGVSFIPMRIFLSVTMLAILVGQGINVYLFDKALKFGENPVETLIAGGIKLTYLVAIYLWARYCKYKANF